MPFADHPGIPTSSASLRARKNIGSADPGNTIGRLNDTHRKMGLILMNLSHVHQCSLCCHAQYHVATFFGDEIDEDWNQLHEK
jgi:hypothetical protein